jgi:Cu-Zn family superoxide dismutase
MKRLVGAFLITSVLALPGRAQDEGVVTLETTLIGVKGDPIGQVTIRGSANATVLRIIVNPGGLTPGWHGASLNSNGDCSDAGRFRLAKGHINHLVKKHGLLNAEGPDEGDLPNIHAAADGSVNAEVSSLTVRILGQNGLTDGDGSALIIHAGEDDHTSQPIGNAGARVACAVIK